MHCFVSICWWYVYVSGYLLYVTCQSLFLSLQVAQKYISDPVLFYRDDIDGKVKFDIRYIVMLLSVKPLKVSDSLGHRDL